MEEAGLKNNFLRLTNLNQYKDLAAYNNFNLGAWCDHKRESSKNNTSYIVPYHWDNRIKFNDDYKKLKKLHNKIIDDLVKLLNNFHTTNKPRRYWQLLLDPWLVDYLAILFDRWEIIKTAAKLNKNFEVEFYQFTSDTCLNNFYSYPGMQGFLQQNDINQYLFQKIILKYFSNNFHITQSHKTYDIKFEDTTIFSKQEANFKNYIKNLYRFFVSSIFKKQIDRQKIFIIDSFLNFYNSILFNLRIKQIPIDNMIKDESFSSNYEIDVRNNLINKKIFNNNFYEFIFKEIILNLNTMFIEDYQKNIKKINDKSNHKIIIFSEQLLYNNFKSLWLANQIQKKTKLFYVEHGGSFPKKEYKFNYHREISDKCLTWYKAIDKQDIQIPVQKKIYSSPSTQNYMSNSNCSLLAFGGRKFTYSAQYLPQGFTQSQVVYNDVINFFNTIDKDIKKKFKIKTHHNLGFNEEKKFIKDLGNEIISKSSYIDFIRKSKVIICTYPETTFTESLASGIPTILFFKKELFELNPQTSELVSLMHKAKIIFYSAEEAADHLNEVWYDLEKWWNKKETIYARKVFFQEAAIISRSWVNLSDQEINNIFY